MWLREVWKINVQWMCSEGIFGKTWLSPWVPESMSEKVTSREAITSKNLLGLGFYTVLWHRRSWVQFCLWHYILCIWIFSGGIWVKYHYYGDGGSLKMLKKILGLGFYTCMGTFSFMALYALYLDILWWYLSHISLLWRWGKPEDVEKK